MDNEALGNMTLKVELEDLMNFDWKLEDDLKSRPQEIIPIFEEAAKQVYLNLKNLNESDKEVRFQILIIASDKNPIPLRQLKSDKLG